MALDIPFDNSYARMPPRFFARAEPVAVAAPRLLALNEPLAEELALDVGALRSADGLAVLAGNAVAGGSEPMALAYAGHQFGGWVPQLGDGRAHLLGEVVDRAGRRRDIQLKGSGRTPFSRGGDGRAWLGPVLREYLVSEAMHALGVPTTRALAAVATGERVQREQAYPGAVLTRVAASHIRVGTFQYFAARRDLEALEALKDHVIARHYPEVAGAEDEAMALFGAIVAAQAGLVAKWMGLGFIHGVMNTDNTSVSGETIDYGPCAFMDMYQAGKVYSSIDARGRYAYANQPEILVWNLAQLGGALLPLMSGDEDSAAERATEVLRGFGALYEAEWAGMARAKLGLGGAEGGDARLMRGLLVAMEEGQADFTNVFRGLSDGTARDWFTDPARFDAWEPAWAERRARGSDDDAMARANPAVIPRNHRIEEVIQAALKDDLGPFERLARVLAQPFDLDVADRDLALPPEPEEEVRMTFCGT